MSAGMDNVLSEDEELITEETAGKIVDSELDTQYYTEKDIENGFEVTFEVMDMNRDGLFGKYIFLKYSATTNENAVTVISKNNATLNYSNDPTDSKKTTTMTTDEQVYSAKILIDKYEYNSEDEDDSTTKLSGASFVLYKEESGNESYYHYHEKNVADPNDVAKVEWYTLAEIIDKINENAPSTLDTSATLADVLKLDESVYGDYITVKTTDANGAANFDGLKDGTYQLLETAAPAGYNLLDAPVSVTVDGSKATETSLTSLTATRKVANKTGSLLPGTGGIGTTIFYVVGSILLVGAAVLLITRKRMNSAK